MKVLQEILVPQESVNDEYLTVVEIPFVNGDEVKKNDIVIELETSKAVVALVTEVDGYIEYLCNIEDEVNVNTPIVKIWNGKVQLNEDIRTKYIQSEKEKEVIVDSKKEINKVDNEPFFSFKALELIKEKNILKEVFNSLDFVNERVVLKYLNLGNFESELSTKAYQTKNKEFNKDSLNLDLNKVTVNKISHLKKREIENLIDVQSSGLVSIVNIDLSTKNYFESVNGHLHYFKESVLPVIVYECSRLLVKYPLLNAYYLNNEIVVYRDVNVGVAMDIDNGLKVVKIPNTNKLNLIAVEENIFNLANKYIDKRLDTSDLTDITFTITDLSSYGVYSFSPLINKNNSAILGISKTDEKLERVILSLAFDHRVTEGKIVALFLQDLKDRFESYCFKNQNENNKKNICCSKCMKTLDEDLNDIGFIKIVNKNGEDKYICELCLLRF